MKIYDYTTNQPDNLVAWKIGEACRAANPGGDPIDLGLSLLQKLEEKGLRIVQIERVKRK